MTILYMAILLLLGYMVAVACTEDYSQSCSDWNIQQNVYRDGVFPNDSGMECPPGLFCNNRTCKCAHYHYPYDSIKCDEEKGTSALLDCYCATFDDSKNVTRVGACIYYCNNNMSGDDNVYNSLTRNNSIIICSSFNRAGALCGRCLPEHYPLAYSFNLTCIKCSHVGWNWGRYIVAAYLPLTLFCFFVLFFEINAVTSHLHPVIWCSQAISMSAMSRMLFLHTSLQKHPIYLIIIKITLALYGVWNFDFFRTFYSDICLGIGFLPTLALDYVIAVYPLLLMAITCLLVNLYDKNYRFVIAIWKPFQAIFFIFKKNFNIRTSMIDSCVTFFYLSSVKFLSVTFDLLVPTPVYELHQDGYNYTFGLYYSGDIEYFGKEHLPYAILAIIVSIVFVVLPLIVLALYPFAFFQKFLNCIPVRWHILYTFMDAFQGVYKDGTESGTRDCRWFAAVFFLVRVMGFVAYAFAHNIIFFYLAAILLILLVLLIVNVQPFKAPVAHYSKVNATFFSLFILIYIVICGKSVAGIKVRQFLQVFYVLLTFAGFTPLLYTLLLILYWIYSHSGLGSMLASMIRFRRRGYKLINACDSMAHVRDHTSSRNLATLSQ